MTAKTHTVAHRLQAIGNNNTHRSCGTFTHSLTGPTQPPTSSAGAVRTLGRFFGAGDELDLQNIRHQTSFTIPGEKTLTLKTGRVYTVFMNE